MAVYNNKLASNLLTVVSIIIFTVVLVINYLASEGPTGPFKFLHNTSRALSDKYNLEITPAPWTFGITWGTIFAWQAVWLLYSLSFLCRSDIVVLTPVFFIFYNLANIGNASWVFVFGTEMINLAFAVLLLIQVFLCAALTVLYRQIRQLEGGKLPKGDFIAIQALIINGLAFYTTWVSIATLLNFGIVLTFTAGVEDKNSSTITLSILAVEIIVWYVMDLVVFNSMTKYTISPWVVLIVALVGSIDKNYVAYERNSIFTLVLLCVVAVLAFTRLVIFVFTIFQRRNVKSQNLQK